MRSRTINSLIRLAPCLLAGLLTLLWAGAAFVARGDQKDLYYLWALAHLSWADPDRAYDPGALAALMADLDARELDPTSRFRRMVGAGPYPPPHPLLFAPMGALDPRSAAVAMGLLDLLLAWGAALLVARLPGMTWSACALLAALLLFPGYYYNLALGQNALVTLGLVVLGWWLLEGGRDAAAGAVLALLAYKPQWLVAALWLLLVVRRPRAVAGLLAGLGVVVGGTLAAFGPGIWRAYFPVASYAARWYGEAPAKLGMAFDLRALVVRASPTPSGNAAGFALSAATALGVALLLGGRGRLGDRTARSGLLLSALLFAPHAMYYDLTVFLLPLALLLASSRGWSAPARPCAWLLAGALYLALPIMSEWPVPERHAFSGPPVATVVLVGLLATTVVAALSGPAVPPAGSTS